MAKNNKGNETNGEQATEQGAVNVALVYRRDHPKDRCSYGVAGNPGIVVFDKALFLGGDQPGFVPPATITLSCPLVDPKADNKELKAQQAAARAEEKAAKAKEKAEAAATKVAEKAAKAAAALKAAQDKVTAAQAEAAPVTE